VILIQIIAFVTVLSLVFFTKKPERALTLIIVALTLNPVIMRVGIFENSNVALFGNTVLHLIVPILLLLRFKGQIFPAQNKIMLSYLFFAFFVLFFSDVALNTGLKALLLIAGTVLWISAIRAVLEQTTSIYRNLKNSLFIAIICGLALGWTSPDLYIQEGRLGISGGYNSLAMAGALLILLNVTGRSRFSWRAFAELILGLTTILATGSRSVALGLVIALFVYILIPHGRNNSRLNKRKIVIGGATGLFAVLSQNFAGLRGIDVVSLISDGAISRVGTVQFREITNELMLNVFSSASFSSQIFGLGTGSGTAIAQNWISGLGDDYTSARVFHNVMLQALIETGVIGLIFVATYLIVLVGRPKNYSSSTLFWTWLPLLGFQVFTSNPLSVSSSLGLVVFIPFLLKHRSVEELE
jgi:hypothetical protein